MVRGGNIAVRGKKRINLHSDDMSAFSSPVMIIGYLI
jgi:hypothetical protein